MFKSKLKENRPHLSEKSLTTYNSVLTSLFKKVYPNKQINEDDLNDDDKILSFLKDIPANKRKTIIASLVVLYPENKAYENALTQDISTYNTEIKEMKMTPEQKQNWVSMNEIKNIYNKLQSDAKALYKKTNLTDTDLQNIQQYIILSLYILTNPRRSLDYTEMKILDIDKDKNNYIQGKNFVFNIYKGSTKKGSQVVPIPDDLRKIIKKWISINPSEYLLFDRNNEKLNSVKLNQRLNKIFDGKKLAINGLRHIYLTDKYKDTMKQVNEMEKDMEEMGSSIKQAKNYVKIK